MRHLVILLCTCVLLTASCRRATDNHLGVFEVFCEMVASDAKPIALHYPMEAAELDRYWEEYKNIANQMDVQIQREDSFPVSALFPAQSTIGKSVVLIYKGDRLTQYEQWKTDLQATNPEDRAAMEDLARRLGRLLGYSPQGINRLLMANTDYRTLESFGVPHQVTHLYYEKPEEAIAFYHKVLGLPPSGKAHFQIGADASIEIHAFDEAHPSRQPKSTAIALLTDQLAEWYAHVQASGVPIKYTYKPKDGGPHDGFVAIDPGGYLLEFEQFKQHPENELFMAVLARAPRLETGIQNLTFYGSITWTYHRDLLAMQQFYEEVLGFRLVADQGWTKIYQTSPTGFVGLVDERRGMQDYAQEKAVEVEWHVRKAEDFNSYADKYLREYQTEYGLLTGPEFYRYRIRKALD